MKMRGNATTANGIKTLPNRIVVTGPAHAESIEFINALNGKPFKQQPQLRTVSVGHSPNAYAAVPPITFDTWQPKRRKKRTKPMPSYPKHQWSL